MESGKCSLVAGGAGFIGSHLCEALLGLGHRVVCVDNLLTGRKENLAEANKNPDFNFVQASITEKLVINDHLDYIFHLASPASVPDYQKYWEETALANSQGTYKLLKLAEKDGSTFLFASTSEVYGDPKEHPQKESYWGNVNPVGVRACYDESKRFGEMITTEYIKKHGLDGRIVRIFNTYGERMRKDDGRVVSNFINQAISGKPITVYGKGDQTRSFCYVSDLVAGITKAMFATGTAGEVINLGNPEEYKMSDLALKIKAMTGSASEIVNGPLPEDDPGRRCPDISKAITLLGWKPVLSVDEGLQKTIAYYRSLQ